MPRNLIQNTAYPCRANGKTPFIVGIYPSTREEPHAANPVVALTPPDYTVAIMASLQYFTHNTAEAREVEYYHTLVSHNYKYESVQLTVRGPFSELRTEHLEFPTGPARHPSVTNTLRR
jgi:hypothetical protein